MEEFSENNNIDYCSLCDMKNDFYEDKYVECCCPFKIDNGSLFLYNYGKNVEKAKNYFYNEIENLCRDTKNYNSAKCAA